MMMTKNKHKIYLLESFYIINYYLNIVNNNKTITKDKNSPTNQQTNKDKINKIIIKHP